MWVELHTSYPPPEKYVLCEAKRDCDPEDTARWIGFVRVTRIEGTKIWFKPPQMRNLRRDRVGRFPGRYWHFRLRPEAMYRLSEDGETYELCDERHT